MDLDNDVPLDDLLATYDAKSGDMDIKYPFVGLWNLGNTCFFNSIIQMLYYCPGFRLTLFAEEGKVKQLLEDDSIESVLKEKKACSIQTAEEARNKCSVFIELCQLFTQMSGTQKSFLDNKLQEKCTVRPTGLMDVLRKSYPVFAPYTQQDAQECLRCILSILQDVISLVLKKGLTREEPAKSQDGEKKLFGGRKLDGNGSATTSAEESQRENRDPNKLKQESRSTTLRKKKAKSLLRNPLRNKLVTGNYPLNTLNNGNTPQHEESVSPRKSAVEYESLDGSATESGCFGKLNRKLDRKVPVPVGQSSTPNKRVNEDEPGGSLTPPPKRRRLNLSAGLKHLYKPIASSILKTKTAGLSEKYTLQKSNGSGKCNPFKVTTKFESSPKYRLLDLDNKDTGDREFKTNEIPQLSTISPSKGSENTSSKSNSIDITTSPKAHKCDGAREEMSSSASDFVENLFQGQLVNEIRCMECESSLQRTENFMDISLPVKEDSNGDLDEKCQSTKHDSEHCSVIWGLTEFMSKEILDGENKYYCAHCSRYVEGERKLQFSRIPPILTLHLKRFTSSKSGAGGNAFCSTVSKINSSLQVPFELSLREWCTETCKQKTAKYKLFGIVIHSGITISSGHYLSYVHLNKSTGLFEDQSSSDIDSRLTDYDGSWLEADDDITKVIPQEEFQNLLSPENGSRTPYLLFYQRQE